MKAAVSHCPHGAPRPAFSIQLLAFLSCNCMVSLMFLSFVGTIVGAFVYPKTVGLYGILPYFTYTFFLKRVELIDGSHWPWFSQNFFFLKWMRNFFQLSLVAPKELTDDKDPNAQYIFGLFPHGSFADYRAPMDGLLPEVLPHNHIAFHTRTLAASVLFRIPLAREIALWTGCVDARRAVAESLLDRGRSLIVLPGGEAEQIRTVRGKECVYLKERKGFLKLALRKNTKVVPVYVFGASDYYYTSNFLFGPRVWLQKKFGVCIPWAVGLWGSPLCPLPIPTTVVFGAPLTFAAPKVRATPTLEEVNTAHKMFCTALVQLFDQHKESAGYDDRNLIIA